MERRSSEHNGDMESDMQKATPRGPPPLKRESIVQRLAKKKGRVRGRRSLAVALGLGVQDMSGRNVPGFFRQIYFFLVC